MHIWQKCEEFLYNVCTLKGVRNNYVDPAILYLRLQTEEKNYDDSIRVVWILIRHGGLLDYTISLLESEEQGRELASGLNTLPDVEQKAARLIELEKLNDHKWYSKSNCYEFLQYVQSKIKQSLYTSDRNFDCDGIFMSDPLCHDLEDESGRICRDTIALERAMKVVEDTVTKILKYDQQFASHGAEHGCLLKRITGPDELSILGNSLTKALEFNVLQNSTFKPYRDRFMSIQELLSTELNYMRLLEEMMSLPISNLLSGDIESGPERLLYSAYEGVVNVTRILNAYLYPAYVKIDQFINRDHENSVQEIKKDIDAIDFKNLATVFFRIEPLLCEAYSKYCKITEKERNGFVTKCNTLNLKCGDLRTLLQAPIQRIIQYKELIKKIMKNSPKGSEEYIAISEAFSSLLRVNDICNEAARVRQSEIHYEKLLDKFRESGDEAALQEIVQAGKLVFDILTPLAKARDARSEVAEVRNRESYEVYIFEKSLVLLNRDQKSKFVIRHSVSRVILNEENGEKVIVIFENGEKILEISYQHSETTRILYNKLNKMMDQFKVVVPQIFPSILVRCSDDADENSVIVNLNHEYLTGELTPVKIGHFAMEKFGMEFDKGTELVLICQAADNFKAACRNQEELNEALKMGINRFICKTK